MPAETCADGTLGGNTGRCIVQPGGGCGWEIRECASQGGPSACPPAPPAVKTACAVEAGRLCSYPQPDASERVCHCEDAAWVCYDKPPAAPPG
jgi:hypothetical protein